MRRMMLSFFVIIFPCLVLANGIGNNSFNDPKSIISILKGDLSFNELENPYCLAKVINQDREYAVYFKAGFYVAELKMQKTVYTNAENESIPSFLVDVIFKHSAGNSEDLVSSFYCRIKGSSRFAVDGSESIVF